MIKDSEKKKKKKWIYPEKYPLDKLRQHSKYLTNVKNMRNNDEQ